MVTGRDGPVRGNVICETYLHICFRGTSWKHKSKTHINISKHKLPGTASQYASASGASRCRCSGTPAIIFMFLSEHFIWLCTDLVAPWVFGGPPNPYRAFDFRVIRSSGTVPEPFSPRTSSPRHWRPLPPTRRLC